MPGITIIPGTAWDVRPLAEVTRPMVWPQARKGFYKRPLIASDQFQSRVMDFGGAAPGSYLVPPFASGPITLPPVDMWLMDSDTPTAFTPPRYFYRSYHHVLLQLEWFDPLPESIIRVRHTALGGASTGAVIDEIVTTGGGTFPVNYEIEFLFNPTAIWPEIWEDDGNQDLIDGNSYEQVYGASRELEAFEFANPFYDPEESGAFAEFVDMTLLAGAQTRTLIGIANDSESECHSCWRVSPSMTATHVLTPGASPIPSTVTGRTIRLYNEDGWGFLTPDGFTVTPITPFF